MDEGVRKTLALTGCGLWLASSLMPWFGEIAEHAVLCRGREFTGGSDGCFSDDLPLLELAAPLAALLLLYPFARFAFTVFAPAPKARLRRWRWASRHAAGVWHPALSWAGIAGAIWAAWRSIRSTR